MDEKVLSKLSKRAKQHGLSREEGVRRILIQAVEEKSFEKWLKKIETSRRKQPLQPSSTALIRQMREEE